MSGHPDPRTLALWAGGDLDSIAMPQLAPHVHSCAECRQTVAELERAQALLRAAFAEPSEVDLKWVRTGISRRVMDRGRTSLWSWPLGIAATVLVLLFAAVTHRPPPPGPATLEDIVQLPLSQPRTHVSLEIAKVKQPKHRSPRHAFKDAKAGLVAINLARRADGLAQMRLTTTDPNILIILPSTETVVEQ